MTQYEFNSSLLVLLRNLVETAIAPRNEQDRENLKQAIRRLDLYQPEPPTDS